MVTGKVACPGYSSGDSVEQGLEAAVLTDDLLVLLSVLVALLVRLVEEGVAAVESNCVDIMITGVELLSSPVSCFPGSSI